MMYEKWGSRLYSMMFKIDYEVWFRSYFMASWLIFNVALQKFHKYARQFPYVCMISGGDIFRKIINKFS